MKLRDRLARAKTVRRAAETAEPAASARGQPFAGRGNPQVRAELASQKLPSNRRSHSEAEGGGSPSNLRGCHQVEGRSLSHRQSSSQGEGQGAPRKPRGRSQVEGRSLSHRQSSSQGEGQGSPRKPRGRSQVEGRSLSHRQSSSQVEGRSPSNPRGCSQEDQSPSNPRGRSHGEGQGLPHNPRGRSQEDWSPRNPRGRSQVEGQAPSNPRSRGPVDAAVSRNCQRTDSQRTPSGRGRRAGSTRDGSRPQPMSRGASVDLFTRRTQVLAQRIERHNARRNERRNEPPRSRPEQSPPAGTVQQYADTIKTYKLHTSKLPAPPRSRQRLPFYPRANHPTENIARPAQQRGQLPTQPADIERSGTPADRLQPRSSRSPITVKQAQVVGVARPAAATRTRAQEGGKLPSTRTGMQPRPVEPVRGRDQTPARSGQDSGRQTNRAQVGGKSPSVRTGTQPQSVEPVRGRDQTPARTGQDSVGGRQTSRAQVGGTSPSVHTGTQPQPVEPVRGRVQTPARSGQDNVGGWQHSLLERVVGRFAPNPTARPDLRRAGSEHRAERKPRALATNRGTGFIHQCARWNCRPGRSRPQIVGGGLARQPLPAAAEMRRVLAQIGCMSKCSRGFLPPKPGDASPVVILDLETTGLSRDAGTLAFMVGVAYVHGGEWIVEQWTLERLGAEAEMLAAVLACIEREVADDAVLITFNGRTFDLPLLLLRLARHRLDTSRISAFAHLDLLLLARRLWRDVLPNCRLATLESQILGIRRQADISGSEIPALYWAWLQRPDDVHLGRQMARAQAHNHADLLSLAILGQRIAARVAAPTSAQEALRVADLLVAGQQYNRAQATIRAALTQLSSNPTALARSAGSHASNPTAPARSVGSHASNPTAVGLHATTTASARSVGSHASNATAPARSVGSHATTTAPARSVGSHASNPAAGSHANSPPQPVRPSPSLIAGVGTPASQSTVAARSSLDQSQSHSSCPLGGRESHAFRQTLAVLCAPHPFAAAVQLGPRYPATALVFSLLQRAAWLHRKHAEPVQAAQCHAIMCELFFGDPRAHTGLAKFLEHQLRNHRAALWVAETSATPELRRVQRLRRKCQASGQGDVLADRPTSARLRVVDCGA